jgi:hypothetical protein
MRTTPLREAASFRKMAERNRRDFVIALFCAPMGLPEADLQLNGAHISHRPGRYSVLVQSDIMHSKGLLCLRYCAPAR